MHIKNRRPNPAFMGGVHVFQIKNGFWGRKDMNRSAFDASMRAWSDSKKIMSISCFKKNFTTSQSWKHTLKSRFLHYFYPQNWWSYPKFHHRVTFVVIKVDWDVVWPPHLLCEIAMNLRMSANTIRTSDDAPKNFLGRLKPNPAFLKHSLFDDFRLKMGIKAEKWP